MHVNSPVKINFSATGATTTIKSVITACLSPFQLKMMYAMSIDIIILQDTCPGVIYPILKNISAVKKARTRKCKLLNDLKM